MHAISVRRVVAAVFVMLDGAMVENAIERSL